MNQDIDQSSGSSPDSDSRVPMRRAWCASARCIYPASHEGNRPILCVPGGEWTLDRFPAETFGSVTDRSPVRTILHRHGYRRRTRQVRRDPARRNQIATSEQERFGNTIVKWTRAVRNLAGNSPIAIGSLNYDGFLHASLAEIDRDCFADLASGYGKTEHRVGSGSTTPSCGRPIRTRNNLQANKSVHLLNLHGSLGWLRHSETNQVAPDSDPHRSKESCGRRCSVQPRVRDLRRQAGRLRSLDDRRIRTWR